MNKKPYLADVQVGDKLYNFLEGNREYKVIRVDRSKQPPLQLEATEGCGKVVIGLHGSEVLHEVVPYYLYQPVDVLDPKNLPPRPWRPKKGEWVWCRCPGDIAWNLRRFICKEGNRYLLEKACGVGAISYYDEIAPFKGELPPGLEINDESD